MEAVKFTSMDQGTAEEFDLLGRLWNEHRDETLVDNLLALLRNMQGPTLGYRIDRYEHSLQTATRALRDGADEETAVVALLHDIADTFAPDNHSEAAAAVLKPYVSEANHWIARHHGLFQGSCNFHHTGGDRNARDTYRVHPHFQATVDFCEKWDQASFDPNYDTLPLVTFEPMLRRIFETPKQGFE